MKKSDDLSKRKSLSPTDIEIVHGIPKGTLANLRSKKQGCPYFKCGGKILYRVDDFERWLYRNPIRTINSI